MDDQEKRIRQVMQLALARLHVEEGIDLATVLAVSHAEIMALVATAYGGEVARDCLQVAAKQVEGLPSLRDSALARAAPQGRA
jgi:hypothetical protein